MVLYWSFIPILGTRSLGQSQALLNTQDVNVPSYSSSSGFPRLSTWTVATLPSRTIKTFVNVPSSSSGFPRLSTWTAASLTSSRSKTLKDANFFIQFMLFEVCYGEKNHSGKSRFVPFELISFTTWAKVSSTFSTWLVLTMTSALK